MRSHKEIYGGLVRLHVLHHASREPIFGQGIMDELAHHGYRLGPGTIYPILHGLERSGHLRSCVEKSGRSSRRTYVATATGRKALQGAKERIWELFTELFEDELSQAPRLRAAQGRKAAIDKGKER
jgi:DNA-binding PadR family transcriptional regulator